MYLFARVVREKMRESTTPVFASKCCAVVGHAYVVAGVRATVQSDVTDVPCVFV